MTALQPRAFIFDLNGTMIDDMEYHTEAWHHILNNELGASLSREAVKKEMYGKNVELLLRVFGAGKFTAAEMNVISEEKEKGYQQAFRPHLKLIGGLGNFLQQAHNAGIPMAIGSAAITTNIDFVLDGLHLRHYFSAIASADTVAQSKPNPETFLQAAAGLQVAPAACVVFEDAPKGVEAARNAGMQAVVLTTMHAPHEFAAYHNILFFISDYTDEKLQRLLQREALSSARM